MSHAKQQKSHDRLYDSTKKKITTVLIVYTKNLPTGKKKTTKRIDA